MFLFEYEDFFLPFVQLVGEWFNKALEHGAGRVRDVKLMDLIWKKGDLLGEVLHFGIDGPLTHAEARERRSHVFGDAFGVGGQVGDLLK